MVVSPWWLVFEAVILLPEICSAPVKRRIHAQIFCQRAELARNIKFRFLSFLNVRGSGLISYTGYPLHIRCGNKQTVRNLFWCVIYIVMIHLSSHMIKWIHSNINKQIHTVWEAEYCPRQILSLTLLLMMETIRQQFYWLASLHRQSLNQSHECLNGKTWINHLYTLLTHNVEPCTTTQLKLLLLRLCSYSMIDNNEWSWWMDWQCIVEDWSLHAFKD